MLEIDPSSNAIDINLPCRIEVRDDTPAFGVKSFHADLLFDFPLVFNPEILFRLRFHWRPVTVPAPGPRHIKAAHRLVSRDNVLQDADKYRSVVGTARRKRRAV